MTLEETSLKIQQRFPMKTVCVSHESWRYSRLGTSSMDFKITIQPGFDGYLSQTFGGNTLEECLQKLNKAAEPNHV